MKVLLLYGLNSDATIWDKMLPMFKDIECTIVSYPHAITQHASLPSDITMWVYETYGQEHYDAIIGHSLGGIIALELSAIHNMFCQKIIFIDSNLKPANPFYRNLLTKEHMFDYGDEIRAYLMKNAMYFSDELTSSVQEGYDYSSYVKNASAAIYGIYGDRNQPDYVDKYSDLCLDETIVDNINFYFVEDSCHLPMLENPKKLVDMIECICI